MAVYFARIYVYLTRFYVYLIRNNVYLKRIFVYHTNINVYKISINTYQAKINTYLANSFTNFISKHIYSTKKIQISVNNIVCKLNYTEKLVPHPQVSLAFGFLKVNPLEFNPP